MKIVQVDYPVIFAGIAPGSDWVQKLSEELIRSGVSVDARGQLWIRVAWVSNSLTESSLLFYAIGIVAHMAWIFRWFERGGRSRSINSEIVRSSASCHVPRNTKVKPRAFGKADRL